jgi:hypothetical protein
MFRNFHETANRDDSKDREFFFYLSEAVSYLEGGGICQVENGQYIRAGTGKGAIFVGCDSGG